MTWRGDGGSEGLRTIVPPIVDRLVSFGLALREARNLTKPEVQGTKVKFDVLRMRIARNRERCTRMCVMLLIWDQIG